MSAAKLKNVVILTLLLLNLFLLALIIPARLADLRSRQQADSALSELYEQSDVTLPPQSIPKYRKLYPATLTQDHDALLAAVQTLLGSQVLSQTAANGATNFSSSRGSATLLADGTFTAHLTSEKAADSEAHARQLLQDMGISHNQLRKETATDTVTVYAAVLSAADAPLVTHTLRLHYENGALTQVTGLLLTAGTTTAISADACLTPHDALVAFLGSRLNTGWMGSTVTAVTQGWSAAADPASETCRLHPVYRITTDSGSYLLDGLTATVSPA